MARPNFYSADDDIIKRYYPNTRVKDILVKLDYRFDAFDVQHRAYELGVKHEKIENKATPKSEPKTRLQTVKDKLENLYQELGLTSPLNERYGEILNEINNLEITYENIRHT